jgi:chromosome segregation ATPase
MKRKNNSSSYSDDEWSEPKHEKLSSKHIIGKLIEGLDNLEIMLSQPRNESPEIEHELVKLKQLSAKIKRKLLNNKLTRSELDALSEEFREIMENLKFVPYEENSETDETSDNGFEIIDGELAMSYSKLKMLNDYKPFDPEEEMSQFTPDADEDDIETLERKFREVVEKPEIFREFIDRLRVEYGMTDEEYQSFMKKIKVMEAELKTLKANPELLEDKIQKLRNNPKLFQYKFEALTEKPTPLKSNAEKLKDKLEVLKLKPEMLKDKLETL